MHDRIAYFCLLLAVGCAAGDSGESLSGGQPFDPTGDESTSSEVSDTGTSAATSSAASGGEEDSSGLASTTATEPTSDCCTPAAEPGCTVSETETCVCAIRPACCEDAWSVECAGIAIDGCGSACGTTTMPMTSAGESTTAEVPTVSCGDLAREEMFIVAACESDGNGACGGEGTPTTDCDFCCDVCSEGPTCGDLAEQQSWEFANCENNGNGACGGGGTPTCDCDFCCEVGS